MFLMLSRILSRSNCILILVIFDLASSAPLKSHAPFRGDQGFSTSPKILELQLPFKISSKEDLAAWSKYVTGLMASKINLTSILKNAPLVEKLPFISNSESKETMKKTSLLNEKRQGVNYPARRLKEPHMQRADEKVVAYPLPIGAMKPTAPKSQDPSSLSTSNFNGAADFGQYMDFNVGSPFQQSEIDAFGNFDFLLQPPSNTYLPLPAGPIDTVKPYQNAVDKNVSNFEEPAKLQTMRDSLNFHINNELGQASPFAVNNGLTGLNLSHAGASSLTFPFQAVITIGKELPAATMISKMQSKDYTGVEDLPNEFLPFFEQNYGLMNESENVFNDFTTDVSETKTQGNVRKEKGENKEKNIDQKKQNQKKVKSQSAKKQKSSAKRQSTVLGDLLRTLGILRKLPKNSTEINVASPVLSILKGTNTQKIQVAFEETPPNRGRRNETFQAQQELDEDDDENDNDGNDNDENGNGENGNDDDGNDDDRDEPQTEAQEDDDDEEEEGGSIQAVIDLLPLAAPLLEELSDPNADVDIIEVIQGAIPLLEGLSDPNEEGGFDIPAVLLPLSQKLSQGPDGGSDSGAILGPLIQLIAPVLGPLSGPLLGPLSRTSSGPNGIQGSASIFSASAEPLSKPQGPYGQSILSGLIASITAKLSKESAASAGDSDVKSLVSSIVSGVLAGASAGSHQKGHYGYNKYGQNYGQNTYGQYGHNTYGQYGQNNNNNGQNANRYSQNGNRDPQQSSTSYDHYHSYGYKPTEPPSSIDSLLGPLKEILGAVLKLSGTLSTNGAKLSGASSHSGAGLSASSSDSSSHEPEKPTYGPPPTYGSPTYPSYAAPNPSYAAPSSSPSYAAPPSTKSSYVSYTRRQIPRQKVKKV